MRKPLWTSDELKAVCGAVSARPWAAEGVQIDSRDVGPGDLFIALAGEKSDGHHYVRRALDQGASAAIVSQGIDGLAFDDPRLCRVSDTKDALHKLAAAARERSAATRLAVTGSVGKTTVVQALYQALSAQTETHASVRSFNNHVGVPLSLARMPQETQVGVFELGMSGAGEIDALSAQVRPDISVITAIAPAHLAAFRSVAEIADAKAEIFNGQAPGGLAILGLDHDYGNRLLAAARERCLDVLTISLRASADVSCKQLQMTADGSAMLAEIFGDLYTINLRQPGRAWAHNVLICLAAVRALGLDVARAALALSRIEAEPGRGRAYHLAMDGRRITLIDESYNASPAAMTAAVERLGLIEGKGRRIALLGDMLELGAGSVKAHREAAAALKKYGVDAVWAVSDMIAEASESAGLNVRRITRDNLLAECRAHLEDGDRLLIKGSNAFRLNDVSSRLIGLFSVGRGEQNDSLTYAHPGLEVSTIQRPPSGGRHVV